MGLWQSGNDQKVVNELEDNIGMIQSKERRVKILEKKKKAYLWEKMNAHGRGSGRGWRNGSGREIYF